MKKKRTKKHNSYKRVHIYTFFKFVSRFMYLLIIPLIQHLLLQPESLIGFIGAMGFNVLSVMLLIGLSFAEYRSSIYKDNEEEISLRRGFLLRRQAKIPHSVIETVTVRRTFVSMLMGARKLHMDTPAVGNSSTDINLYLSRRRTKELIENILKTGEQSKSYKSNNLRIMLMAATWSNSFAGLLVFIPFLNRVGKILGDEFSAKLYSTVDISTYIAAIGIPPAAATIAGLMLLCWAISFLSQFFGYFGFKTDFYKDYVEINRGFIEKSRHIIPKEKINVLQIKQSLIMIPMRLYGAFVYTISSGKTKGDKSMLIPAQTYSALKQMLKDIEIFDTDDSRKIKPDRLTLISYLLYPTYITLAMAALIHFMIGKEIQTDIVWLTSAVCFIIAALCYALMGAAHRKSFLSVNKTCVIIASHKGFSLTENIIPYDKVQCVIVQRSIFQRIGYTCNVKIYAYGERRKCFIVRQLNYKETIALLGAKI